MSKIYHLDEMEDFFGSENWKISINVTDIWNNYQNQKITLEQFNNEYYSRLVQSKSNIVGLGNQVWNDLITILNKMREKKEEKELLPIYESIYEWADKNDILIKTK